MLACCLTLAAAARALCSCVERLLSAEAILHLWRPLSSPLAKYILVKVQFGCDL